MCAESVYRSSFLCIMAYSDPPPRKRTKATTTVSDIAFDLVDQGCMLAVICDMLDRYNTTIESSRSDMNRAEVDIASLKDRLMSFSTMSMTSAINSILSKVKLGSTEGNLRR